jgi:hypothetical protein
MRLLMLTMNTRKQATSTSEKNISINFLKKLARRPVKTTIDFNQIKSECTESLINMSLIKISI